MGWHTIIHPKRLKDAYYATVRRVPHMEGLHLGCRDMCAAWAILANTPETEVVKSRRQ